VEDLYFDDDHWTVRYLVVNTGSWLLGRRVLIAPVGVTGVDQPNSAIDVSLTRSQVADAPDIDTAQPISRRQEATYLSHYGWPVYWSGAVSWDAAAFPGVVPAPPVAMTDVEAPEGPSRADEEASHLHSARDVTGCGVEARDGEIGHVEDFLVDDRSWSIRYLAVDPKNFWPGNSVLVPTRWLTSITESVASVRLNRTRAEIRSAPEWEPSASLSSQAEATVARYYEGLTNRHSSNSDEPAESEEQDADTAVAAR